MKNRPPHSSMISAMVLASSPAIMKIFLRPSRTTCTTWESFTDSRLQNGGMTFCSTKNSTYTNPYIHTTFILYYNTSAWLHIWKTSVQIGLNDLHYWTILCVVQGCYKFRSTFTIRLMECLKCVRMCKKGLPPPSTHKLYISTWFFLGGGQLTWSFLPLMVRLLMAHAASFWVPKSPCREPGCH